MHDCKDEHERMHDVIAGSPPAHPHPPNLQPRGKRNSARGLALAYVTSSLSLSLLRASLLEKTEFVLNRIPPARLDPSLLRAAPI